MIKVYSWFIVALAAAAMMLAACSGDDDNSGGVIIPLKIGKTWYYQEVMGETAAKAPPSDYVFFLSVLSTKEIREQTTYAVLAGDPWDYYYADYFRNKDDGIHYYGYYDYWDMEEYIYNAEGLLWKYPCKAGDTYQGFYDEFREITVVSTNAKVTVPAGTYTCVQYEVPWYSNEYGESWSYKYFAPDVGLVKEVVHDIWEGVEEVYGLELIKIDNDGPPYNSTVVSPRTDQERSKRIGLLGIYYSKR